MIQNIEHAITARMSCPVYVDRPALVLPPAPNILILCSCAPVEVPIAPPPDIWNWCTEHQCPTTSRCPPPPEIVQIFGTLRTWNWHYVQLPSGSPPPHLRLCRPWASSGCFGYCHQDDLAALWRSCWAHWLDVMWVLLCPMLTHSWGHLCIEFSLSCCPLIGLTCQ